MGSAQVSNNPWGSTSAATVQGKDRGRTIAIQVTVAVMLIALIAGLGLGIGIGIGIARHRSHDNGAGPIPAVTAGQSAAGLTGSITGNGSIRIGKPGAKVTVRVVADLHCPACKAFEAANGQVIEDEVNNGTAAVEYNIIAFLDTMSSGTRYSSRAAGAAYCVAGADPAKFLPWLITMYQQQPPENGTGRTDGTLIRIAEDAGYTDPATAICLTDHRYDGYVQQVTNDVLNSGIQATPTVFVNGKQVNTSAELMQSGGLRATIDDAAK
jgi:protein-disulfide isomerase